MGEYERQRARAERRRRNIARTVCAIIAIAMLASLVIPALFSGF
ncbi:hypothetical protein [Bifidobacterium psychraerophilum]|jgi:type IV secretory pathway component VirB8|nr:hypothetical protein [Bifidobacterium psychraerophilum]